MGVVMFKKVWLYCHQTLNTPNRTKTENGVAGVVMVNKSHQKSSILKHHKAWQVEVMMMTGIFYFTAQHCH